MKAVVCSLAVALVVAAGNTHAAEDQAAEKKLTPQQAKMKACNAEAREKALKGDERRSFMKECLSTKPAKAASAS